MSLTDLASDLFLFLVTFRRQVRKGMQPEMSSVRSQLLDIFAEQERRADEDANLARVYEKAKYVLVILADEILINSNWSYSSAWEDELLEWEFYKSRVAGEEFFVRLEEEGERDEKVAEIYYLALCLGFVGQYSDDPMKIVDLKRRLYRMLPNRFSDQDKRITPGAYFVAEGAKDNYKPLVNLGRIALICVVLFVGLFIGYRVYSSSVVKEIVAAASVMKSKVPPDPDAEPFEEPDEEEEPPTAEEEEGEEDADETTDEEDKEEAGND